MDRPIILMVSELLLRGISIIIEKLIELSEV